MGWEPTDALAHAVTAVGSGVASFAGAFLRFRQRLAKLEALYRKLEREVDEVRTSWPKEFEVFKLSLRQELEHARALKDATEAAEEKWRDSHPDPTEELHRQLQHLQSEVSKLKERGNRYVRHETFASFSKEQEDQWRAIERTLGRIEGMLK